ncbi:MAG TPA: DUF6776 family protein [Steroidobacteraceae bacterium]|nr:DUF6776 family protein [Steroidobacteraceae bacterium]
MRANTMTELPARLVVRRAAPLKRLLLVAAAVIAGAAALYLVYERGRLDGGYDRISAAEQRSELGGQIAKLEKANATLNARVAELDTLRIGRAQERAELARTIGDLQAQVGRQTQQIEFYRSVLSESAATHGAGLELRQVRITPGAGAGRFDIHLTLLERTRPEAETKGTLELSVEGMAAGKPATLDQAALTDGKTHEQAFSFRYFQTLDEEISLPPDFRAERLTIEAQPRTRSGARPAAASGEQPPGQVVQSFPWRVETP